jgi:hypothetical protein
VAELFRGEREWRVFFRKACEESPERLRSQAKQLRNELHARGDVFKIEEVEDVLLALAREKLPDSLAGRWNAEWASRLCREALARLGEHYAELTEDERERLNLDVQDEYHDRMNVAGDENDPAAFREALAGWELAGLEAFDAARSKTGGIA